MRPSASLARRRAARNSARVFALDEALKFLDQARESAEALHRDDDLARIELGPTEVSRAIESPLCATLVREIKATGYRYVTIDLQGYRMGSLNEGLLLQPA